MELRILQFRWSINLGAESFTGSIAAVHIHTEQMNTADISHNNTGGVGLGTYLFYPIDENFRTYVEDAQWFGDPTSTPELSWRESAHFRSMWFEAENEYPGDDIGARVEATQLPQLEVVYTYLNEKSGKHLPFVSTRDSYRGDGRKYKWIVGWAGCVRYSDWERVVFFWRDLSSSAG